MLWRLRRHIRAVVLIAAIVVIAGAAVAIAGPNLGGSKATPDKLADAKLAPEPWEGRAKPKFRSEQSLQRAAPWDSLPSNPLRLRSTPRRDCPRPRPAATAPTRRPRPAERKRVYTATHPVGGVDSALLLNRTALAPASAPDPIRQMISAANLIVGQPYVWGGGHGSFQSKGYDCSGAVSYALAGAGLLQTPADLGAVHVLRDTGTGPLADDLRELEPRLRGDRRPALGHRRRRPRFWPALAPLRRLPPGLRRAAPARALIADLRLPRCFRLCWRVR